MPLIPAARGPRLCGLRAGVVVPAGATAAGILLTAARQGDR